MRGRGLAQSLWWGRDMGPLRQEASCLPIFKKAPLQDAEDIPPRRPLRIISSEGKICSHLAYLISMESLLDSLADLVLPAHGLFCLITKTKLNRRGATKSITICCFPPWESESGPRLPCFLMGEPWILGSPKISIEKIKNSVVRISLWVSGRCQSLSAIL